MRKFWRTSDPGLLRDVGLVCLADGIVGVSFGATAVAGGLPGWLPVAMSLLVFAGGAQFAAVGVVLAGGSPVAAVAAGALLNTRLFPYGLAVADVTTSGGRWWTRLLGAHVVTDESVAFALRSADPARRRAGFWLCGVALFAVWNVAVLLGVLAGGAVQNTGAFGLDATFPAVLLALAAARARRPPAPARPRSAGVRPRSRSPRSCPPGSPCWPGSAGLAVGWRRRAGVPEVSEMSGSGVSGSEVSGSGVSG